MKNKNSLNYINLTDEEVRGILNGTCTQLIRCAKNSDARSADEIQIENEVFQSVGTVFTGREAWRCRGVYPDNGQVQIEYRVGGMQYSDNVAEYGKFATMAGNKNSRLHWHSASQQPKFSNRIKFEVTAIHIHRLLDLREEDARYVGIEPLYEVYYEHIHPGHTNTKLWGHPWRDYELKTYNGESSARDSYFSWYRYKFGKISFQANEWIIRAEIKILNPNIINS